ncbi:zinc finger CCCH domain-containing protein 65 [Rhododendron vialii]|uniref:zinc finger CCCH domain-containing protein 65 n=1 Tax=Rhododendron vialii TaxID=182163 RepID=UPI00265DC0FE|nr:zinc finger CCCH domain-containing protein 65 [Rhododendron vialii]
MAEQSRFETLNPSDSLFPFPPHRRRTPIKSETLCTLARILSHFNGGDSQHSLSGEVVSVQSKPGIGENELGQGLEPEVHHGTVGPTGVESKTWLTQREAQSLKEVVVDQSFDGDRMEIDEFALLNGVKEKHLEKDNKSGSTLEDNNPCGNFVSSIGDQDGECNLLEICMEESGKEMQEVDKEHPNCDVFESLDLCLDIDIIDELRKLDDNNAEGSSYVERHVLEEVGHEMPLVELEKSVSSSGVMNSPFYLAAGGEIEEGELSGNVGMNDQSPDLLVEDALSLEKKVDEESTFEAISNEEQVLALEGANQEDTKCNKKFVEPIVNVCNGVQLTLKDSSMSAMACDSEMVGGKIGDANMAHGYNSELESRRYKKQDIRTSDKFHCPAVSGNDVLLCYDDVYTVVSGEISAEIATENQGTSSTKKKDAAVREKRKRGPLTEEKKEKKKKKKRIKRAETNRRLGVKRLKIQPIMKPKTVTYCRHFLKGRCQEGEKCKFSHDTIPLTKSMPCCHFARHSCMKGDDCPFDHQLSKYPCNNFSSKGYCSRGTDCMFSHEVQPVEGSTNTITQLKSPTLLRSTNPEKQSDTHASSTNPENQSNTELKSPTLLRSTNPDKQSNTHASSNQKFDYKSTSMLKRPPPRRRTEQNVAESVVKPAVQTPKGISNLMFGVSNQAGSFPKADAGAKLGLPLKTNTPDIAQNSNENRRTTVIPEPKGINFLCFGKAPLHDSSSNKPSGVQKSTVGDSSTEKQSVLYSQNDDGLKVGNQSQGTRTPTVGPRGINFLSFGKAPLDYSCNTKLASVPSIGNNSGVLSSVQESGSASNGRNNVVLSSVQERESASKLQIPGAEPWRVLSSPSPVQERENGSKLKIAGAKPWKMLSSSLHSAISMGQTADEHGKDTPNSSLKALFSNTPNSAQKGNVSNMPNSAQKSLQSMLAFAAKYESGIKMDTPTVSADSGMASSSSQSTSRGSTILDFLNGGGSKTKQ